MREIGIGIVGGGYMGKAHSVAMSSVGAVFDTYLRPRLQMICARTKTTAETYRKAYGFKTATSDWNVLVKDPAGVIGQSRPDATYQFLARRNIPYVLAWAYKKDSEHCYIGFDNQAAAQTITRQVLERGHRNLGVIVGLTQNNDRARDRITGIEHAIADHGAKTAPLQVIEAEYTFQEGAKALDQLLANPSPPTAVICGNEVLAVGAVKRAKQLGLAVPEDLSITGFADIEVSELIDPELTTVHVPHREMGIAAAKSLIAMLKTQTPVESHLLETRIVNRQSLGPAKPH